MRIRRRIIGPAILTIGTVGSLAIGPAMAILSTAAASPAVPVAAGSPSPNGVGYHM
jgi:hypothetical protein